ncbi:hypothetical protein J18TS1_30100 [Oceanobacillus oncorhynchi subsp. incaldanensis]|nr:hypothetical protein J18TS1_30100 [Oceanobacillus oncorhynchi subsp. incaldanensis]
MASKVTAEWGIIQSSEYVEISCVDAQIANSLQSSTQMVRTARLGGDAKRNK